MPETTTKDWRTPSERRREAVARALAASMMGLVKDAEGGNLPDDCWKQMVAKADAVLFLASNGKDHEEAGRMLERNQGTYHGPG